MRLGASRAEPDSVVARAIRRTRGSAAAELVSKPSAATTHATPITRTLHILVDAIVDREDLRHRYHSMTDVHRRRVGEQGLLDAWASCLLAWGSPPGVGRSKKSSGS